ncbi:TonB-dependent receptor [Croceiramulus getboli]|nr:carboxypeptidase-like regulatory domain-containing protein [Flavobacteriaceae bacterium YJPT1-3]
MLSPMLVIGQTAVIKGVVFDNDQNPIGNVNVSSGSLGTQTNSNGFYLLEIPANQQVTITFSHIGFGRVSTTLTLADQESFEFNPVLQIDREQISEVIVAADGRRQAEGVVALSPEMIRKIPGANPGVENLLQTLPGVSSNNELSTTYAVRGGNYDENLVYVNEIEVYRPFLIRSGRQEGLSFVNPDLVRNVDFSAGGFQAQYGDRMSSVLDITYRRPTDFRGGIDASLLGGSAFVEGVSTNDKFTAILGLRYRDNSLLVDAQQTETNFQPVFVDAQTYLTYQWNQRLEVSFLGTASINDYQYEPFARQTNFGSLIDPRAVVILYEGREEDRYDTYLGALKGTYAVNDNLTLKLIGSAYQTQEQEYFDILAQYRLGTPNTNIGDEDIGEVEFTEGAGSQLTHARNDLDAVIVNLQHRGQWIQDEQQLEWGLKYTHEDIRDRLEEYEIVDSAGFSIRPPIADFANDQPYTPFDAPLVPFTSVRAQNETRVDRWSAFVQYSKNITLGSAQAYYNVGVRSQRWTVSGAGIREESQQVVSPRAQFSIKPDWRSDMVFRLAAGVYHQPPFYRELRDSLGQVRPEVEAQRSIHVVLGHDWSFDLWERPFKLVSELYYKDLDNVNPYTLENVRIRYRARNNAVARAYGVDLRLNGEFVPGTESWVSIGVLKTEENIDDRGYIARPTDQRFKAALLFQDYVPTLPSLKLYLNMVYQTGLPGGSPSYADPYDFQSRLPFYFRSDLGVFYVLTDQQKRFEKGHWLSVFQELTAGFEIYNIFDRQNSITNTFVRDANSKRQFAIPNFLTPRVFNVRLSMRF